MVYRKQVDTRLVPGKDLRVGDIYYLRGLFDQEDYFIIHVVRKIIAIHKTLAIVYPHGKVEQSEEDGEREVGNADERPPMGPGTLVYYRAARGDTWMKSGLYLFIKGGWRRAISLETAEITTFDDERLRDLLRIHNVEFHV